MLFAQIIFALISGEMLLNWQPKSTLSILSIMIIFLCSLLALNGNVELLSVSLLNEVFELESAARFFPPFLEVLKR